MDDQARQCAMMRHDMLLAPSCALYTPGSLSGTNEWIWKDTDLSIHGLRALKGISISNSKQKMLMETSKSLWLCSNYFLSLRPSGAQAPKDAGLWWSPGYQLLTLLCHWTEYDTAALDAGSPPGSLYVEAPPSSALPESPNRQPINKVTCTR